MDREVWQATVYGFTELEMTKCLCTCAHTHTHTHNKFSGAHIGLPYNLNNVFTLKYLPEEMRSDALKEYLDFLSSGFLTLIPLKPFCF